MLNPKGIFSSDIVLTITRIVFRDVAKGRELLFCFFIGIKPVLSRHHMMMQLVGLIKISGFKL